MDELLDFKVGQVALNPGELPGGFGRFIKLWV